MTLPFYFIDTFDVLDRSNIFPTLRAAQDAAISKYEPEARIYIYRESQVDEGSGTEVAWCGDVRNIPTCETVHEMLTTSHPDTFLDYVHSGRSRA